ncbi:hypothetical protein B0H14DRAFT_2569440 [Mycena olivaceomarginata]|nr:hypothetical protein B0H14DRAFT_2569440 [Mycena olivaceomarginata]
MVVRLTVCDANGNSIVPQDELPFLIGHLSLFTENGIAPLDMGSSVTGQPPPILYGSLLSIRWRGRFQLGVTLLRISRPDSPGIAEQGTTLAQLKLETQAFLRQGARMFSLHP